MENAVDALKIAFAVMVFTMALSLAMVMFSQAKETSDIVLRTSDVSEYIEYIENTVDMGTSRVVGLETIIPTLYNYYRENYTVIFLDSTNNFMPIYKTQTDPNLWSVGYHNRYFGGKDERVCSFDANEEQRRREPWTTSGTGGNTQDYYMTQNMDAFLSGTTFLSPSGNGVDYNYSSSSVHGWSGTSSFVERFKDTQFDEFLGWYVYNDVSDDDTDSGSGEYVTDNASTTEVKPQTKRVIIYRER